MASAVVFRFHLWKWTSNLFLIQKWWQWAKHGGSALLLTMIYGTESLCIFLAIIRKYSNKSGNVRQFCYHLVGISEYIICSEERRGEESLYDLHSLISAFQMTVFLLFFCFISVYDSVEYFWLLNKANLKTSPWAMRNCDWHWTTKNNSKLWA